MRIPRRVRWYMPVCKCKLRLPGGATPSPDRLTRPAELRLGVINVFAKHNQKPPTASGTRDLAFTSRS